MPKVFISYSHDSPEHEARVLALATRLRGNGIDAVPDLRTWSFVVSLANM